MSDVNPDINIGKTRQPTPPPNPQLDPEDKKIHAVALPILQKPIEESASPLSIASPQSSQINSFEHITRYLPGCEELLKQTEGKEVETLCQDLHEGNWPKILQQNALETLPLYALRAFHGGKITGEQFTTLLIYWSAFSQLPPDQIMIRPIFDANGKVDPEVKAWIEGNIGNELGDRSHLDSKLELFFEKMRKKPPSEQSFLYFIDFTYLKAKFALDIKRAEAQASITGKDSLEFLDEYEHEDTICQAINRTGFNVLHRFVYSEKNYRMIPSLGMMQALLESHGKEKTITITPVIGLSTREDIRDNGLESTREMALAFPGLPLPKEADLISAPFDIDFIYHDFYHSFLANAVPEYWRIAFIQFSDAILDLIEEEQDENIKKFLNEFYERIIDMEHSVFRDSHQERLRPDIEKFLISLDKDMQNAVIRLIPIQAHEAIIDAHYNKKRELKIATELNKISHLNLIGRVMQKVKEKMEPKNH